MQYIFKGILTWFPTHWQIARHSHRSVLWLNTSVHVFWFICLYGITENGRTSCKEQEDRCTHKPIGWILQKTSVESSHVHYNVLFFWWYTLWAGNSMTISILTLSKSPCCQHLCHVAIRHEVWNYVQKTVTQPIQFICTHGTFGHTTVHSTQMHTALFQALYSLMSL